MDWIARTATRGDKPVHRNSARLEPPPCRNELVLVLLTFDDESIFYVMRRLVKLKIGLAAIIPLKKSEIENNPQIQRCRNFLLDYEPRRHPTLQVWRKFRDLCCRGAEMRHKLSEMMESIHPQLSPTSRKDLTATLSSGDKTGFSDEEC